MANKSRKDMEKALLIMYTRLSKATAESEVNGKSQKQIYNGSISDLFADIDVGNRTITSFLWAITHKVGDLSSPLFKKTKDGYIRNSSGFYTVIDQNKVHVTGTALIPYIYDWMKEYKVTPRAKSPTKNDTPVETANPLESYTTEDLAAELMRRGWTITYGSIV